MGKIPSVEDWRSRQLKAVGISFEATAQPLEKYFEINRLPPVEGKKKPVYKEGIIYTNHHPKGEVLKAFLAQTALTPKEIIFIDDRVNNLNSVEDFCKSKGIQFTGVQDDRIIQKHNVFDEKLGQYQFYYLEKHKVWLSDQEAKKKMTLTPASSV